MEIITNNNWSGAKPFFTVLTTTYNRDNLLPRAIKSVENQTYRDFEYIIVDDGSVDSTEETVRSFMKRTDIPVMFIKKENGGCIRPGIADVNTQEEHFWLGLIVMMNLQVNV